MNDPNALLRLFAAAALGWVNQWALMGPKKIPSWVAWGVLGGATIVLYWWSSPTAISDFASNWRTAIVGVVSFFLEIGRAHV